MVQGEDLRYGQTHPKRHLRPMVIEVTMWGERVVPDVGMEGIVLVIPRDCRFIFWETIWNSALNDMCGIGKEADKPH